MSADRGQVHAETGVRIAGKYELRRQIGAGAMGAVYEGVHVELGKRVAIKLIRPEFGGSAEVVGRFRREARAASAIESEHVAQIFDFGRDPTLGLYMVIEYLEGEDLEARLSRERWLDKVEAVTVGWQVARGLARAHAAGVIHRDLKPANVFLSRRDDGSLLAKILDFGISKLDEGKWAAPPAADPAEANLTERGTTVGTPQYMSPEQCHGKTSLDGRTDVWSLCAVLYEALAGEPAFSSSAGFVQVMQQIVTSDVVPLSTRAPWVPERIGRVIDAGLVRQRDRRIPDAAVLAERLVEACPEAAERMRRPRPASLDGGADRACPEQASDPGYGAREPARGTAGTEPPPPSSADGVEIFIRAGDLPVRLEKRRR
ncbi:MAG: serine/threonine protein kinase [Myxococcales bacterium]|nr:serine/threonine protein kinase [Myxococcales bacterium]